MAVKLVVMKHPKDYRKPNGVFDVATCIDCNGLCFYLESAAEAHTEGTGHKMEFVYKTIYIVRGQ